MSVWNALFWGAFSSASLFIGEALAPSMMRVPRSIGLTMAFGAGTLIASVSYELIPATNFESDVNVGVSFIFGALTYFIVDMIVDGNGGEDRQKIEGGDEGSGAAMFVGALLDGLPEAIILGVTLALGGEISVAFVVAIFVSNIPQGVAGTVSLQAAGYSSRHVFSMWLALTIACAAAAALGFVFADEVPHNGVEVEAFAAGAVLTMLADSMMPEGFKYGGKLVGLMTVFGYFVAAGLTFTQ
jgi:ZIP family zinc transporter